MALFTGAAILEEKFVTAYFRFNDDTFAELKPRSGQPNIPRNLLPSGMGAARNLAETDALRLLLSFSQFLPASGAGGIRRET